MRFFLDTEFIESGHEHPLELLSLGIISESGRPIIPKGSSLREFEPNTDKACTGVYVENADADLSNASWWVQKNVLPHLLGGKVRLPRHEIRRGVMEFIDGFPGKPEFWGYFADYDWVIFCQLFGRMIDLPKGWPMYCNDLIQLAAYLEVPKESFPAQKGSEHHAFADAVWNRELYLFLMAEKARKERNG